MSAYFDPSSLAALRELRQALGKQPIALVGAAALGCRLDMRWRDTADVDLVVAASLEELGAALGALKDWSQNPRLEREWRASNGTKIDILPVSSEALKAGSLTWPKSGFAMSLVGMRHAFAAPTLSLGEDIELRVPEVPAIALLKMAAYLDRPYERERDLKDLAHILDEYPGLEDERLYQNPEILTRQLNPREAGPFLLGRILRSLVDGPEAEAVGRFLERARGVDLASFVANGPWSRFEPSEAERRLDALLDGFVTAPE